MKLEEFKCNKIAADKYSLPWVGVCDTKIDKVDQRNDQVLMKGQVCVFKPVQILKHVIRTILLN